MQNLLILGEPQCPTSKTQAIGVVVVEELAVEQLEMETKQYICSCQGCDRFGVVSGWDEYYGTIYHCKCLPVFAGIDPQTVEKVEGG